MVCLVTVIHLGFLERRDRGLGPKSFVFVRGYRLSPTEDIYEGRQEVSLECGMVLSIAWTHVLMSQYN